MIKTITSVIMAFLLIACEYNVAEPVENLSAEEILQQQYPHRTYIGEHNYIEMKSSLKRQFNDGVDRSQIRDFPRYYIYQAKEWPREDLDDASSYDLPRIQFFWGNIGDENHPLYNQYEGKEKIWSMKTDGTDLRLVTDDFFGISKGKMVRSPNNRYLAYGYADENGTNKAVYDLKTGESYILANRRGTPSFVWAEDSSYLYFADTKRIVYKWDVETKEKERVDIYISEGSVMYDDLLYVVAEGGVIKYDGITEQKKESLLWYEGLTFKDAAAKSRSISPTGRYAWASSGKYGFEIDTHTGEVIRHEMYTFLMPHLLGVGGRFGANEKVTTMNVRDFKKDLAWKWRPFGTNRVLGVASLYNGFANNGLWFKEVEL